MDDKTMYVSMICPVCGNDQFESLDSEFIDLDESSISIQFRCADCGAVYTREELMIENSEKIQIAVDEVSKQLLDDFDKEFKKVMKKWK